MEAVETEGTRAEDSDKPNGMTEVGGSVLSAENSETVPAAVKKRNRRKGRTKQKPLQSEQDTSIVAQIESLQLNSSPLPIGIVQVLNADDESKRKHNDTARPPSPNKKKNHKKKNIALASIQKLVEENKGPQAVFVSDKAAAGSRDTQGSPVKSPVKSCGLMKTGKPGSSIMTVKLGNSSNRDKPVRASRCLKPEKSSFLSLPQPNTSDGNSQLSKPQHKNEPNSSRNKQKQGGGSRSKANKTGESMMDENKFEDHLQRELAEVMLKEKQPSIVKGFIRINQRNYREAYISSPDGSRDILIDGVKDRNRALEGDEVVVMIYPESRWKIHEGVAQKVGQVVHILTLINHRQAVGSLKMMQDKNTRTVLFSPRDSRVPRMHIPMKECPKNPKDWEKGLFHARIIQWNDVRFAKGQLIGDSIGVQGDIEAETRAILLENELDCSAYDQKLHVFFPKPPFTPSEEDLHGREDLRKLCIFTIDPSTARDLDDAVSCEKLKNGNYKVGVHISDVSYFLREGTPLDKAVSKRATTTYLVQRAYHMLPREMTMMCSLLPGEDKLAYSVFWEITPDAEAISHYITRSVIHSCTQLAYEHAQIMIDEPNYIWKEGELPTIHDGWTVEDIKQVVLSLQSLAVIMRNHRFETGALRVDQTKLMFNLNESGEPVDFSAYVNKESHRLIEEFMLLANMTVATDLQKRFPSLAFLRCHDEPQPDLLKKLSDVLEKFGIVLDTSSAGSLHQSLKRYASGDAACYMALNSLCARPMVRAQYFCAAKINDVTCMRHYALNVPLYTHFTSPIRRYADVMVHRLLSALLGYCEEPKWSIDYVNDIAATCNKMKFCAKRAGEQSNELFLTLWVKMHGVINTEAVVIDVKDHSFDALVCSTGTNIRIYTDKLAGSVEHNNSPVPELRITWALSGERSQPAFQVVTMFSVVSISLRVSNTNLLKLEAFLLPPSE